MRAVTLSIWAVPLLLIGSLILAQEAGGRSVFIPTLTGWVGVLLGVLTTLWWTGSAHVAPELPGDETSTAKAQDGAELAVTDFSGADLSGANLSGTNLADVDLRGANLRSADLRGADLRSALLGPGRRAHAHGGDAGGA